MNKINDLPESIPVFPLSNIIFFPNTSAPLNIFEPRYIQMINQSIKSNRMIGMIQPKGLKNSLKPDVFKVGSLGKISSLNETVDGRYVIVLNGITRFNIVKEINNEKPFEITDKILCKLNKLEINNENVNSYSLELYSKELELSELKAFINELKRKYLYEKKNYFFNSNKSYSAIFSNNTFYNFIKKNFI